MWQFFSFSLPLLAFAAMTLLGIAPVLRWKLGRDLPVPKGGYGSGFLNGKLILAGGTHWKDGEKLWMDETIAYDPRADRWESLPPLPKPLAYAASASDGIAFYFLGGAGPDTSERKSYPLKLENGRYLWEPFTELPMDRCYARAVILNGQLLVIGGTTNLADLSTASTSVLAVSLSDARATWKTLNPMPGEGRAVFAAAVCAGKLFVFGGCTADTKGNVRNLSSACQYDPSLNRWSQLKDVPVPTRGWGASAADDRYVYLFGGYSISESRDSGPAQEGQFENRVYRYDTVQGDYEEATPMPHASSDISFHYFDGAFYGGGGEPKMKARSPWIFIGKP
jgi:N-acetylneuraminic acid mutarotase